MSLNTIVIVDSLVVRFYEIQISMENSRGCPDALSARATRYLSRGKRSLLFTSDRETDVRRVAACNQRRITYSPLRRNCTRSGAASSAGPSFIASSIETPHTISRAVMSTCANPPRMNYRMIAGFFITRDPSATQGSFFLHAGSRKIFVN